MINSSRSGCCRAFSSQLLLPKLASAHIPLAESSSQALRRSQLLSRQRRHYTSDEFDNGKGKFPARIFPRVRAKRIEGEEEARISRRWPSDPHYPYHTRHEDRVSIAASPNDPPIAFSTPRHPPAWKPPEKIHPCKIPSQLENPLSLSVSERRDGIGFLEVFSHSTRFDPILTFLSLGDISQEDFGSLTAEAIEQLFQELVDLPKSITGNIRTIPKDHTATVLLRLRDHLESLTHQSANLNDSFSRSSGRTVFRGANLRRHIDVSIMFGNLDIAYDTFQRLPQQLANRLTSRSVLEEIADIMLSRGTLDLMIDCFTHHLFPTEDARVPFQYWTTKVFVTVSKALLGMQRPEAVLELYKRYCAAAPPGHTLPSFVGSYLLEAALKTGQRREAVKFRQMAIAKANDNRASLFAVQRAIVRAQGTLGLDETLEAVVLKDLPTDSKQAARLLYHLIRIRLSVRDFYGARKLLQRFDLTARVAPISSWTTSGQLSPTSYACILAFQAYTNDPTIAEVTNWWVYLSYRPVVIDDHSIPILISAMARVGLHEEAFQMIYAALNRSEPESLTWILPSNAQVGINSLNELSKCMAEDSGLTGLQKALDLMRDFHFDPNAETVSVILGAMTKLTTVSSSDLSRFLVKMLRKADYVRPTIDHVNWITRQALKMARKRPRVDGLSAEEQYPLSDPAGGLVAEGDVAESIDPILGTLREQRVMPHPQAINIRLRYEARMSASSPDVPAAERVWQELIELGYKPNRGHMAALINGFIDAGRIDQAHRVFNLAQTLKVRMASDLYVSLIVGYGTQGEYGLEQARKIYEEFKTVAKTDRSIGHEQVAVTAMTQAYLNNQFYQEAKELVSNDMIPLADLDDKAIYIGMFAFSSNGNEAAAVDMLERRGSPQLNFFLRHRLNRIRAHLERKILTQTADETDYFTLSRAKEALDRDIQARPWLAATSLFTAPPEEAHVPRGKSLEVPFPLIDNNTQAILESLTPRIGPKDLYSLRTYMQHNEAYRPLEGVLDRIERIFEERRQALTRELIQLRPGITRNDPVVTNVEQDKIKEEMTKYENAFMRAITLMARGEYTEDNPTSGLAPLQPKDDPGSLDRVAEKDEMERRAAERRLERQREAATKSSFSKLLLQGSESGEKDVSHKKDRSQRRRRHEEEENEEDLEDLEKSEGIEETASSPVAILADSAIERYVRYHERIATRKRVKEERKFSNDPEIRQIAEDLNDVISDYSKSRRSRWFATRDLMEPREQRGRRGEAEQRGFLEAGNKPEEQRKYRENKQVSSRRTWRERKSRD